MLIALLFFGLTLPTAIWRGILAMLGRPVAG